MSRRTRRFCSLIRRIRLIQSTEGASPSADLPSGSSTVGLSATATAHSSELIVRSSDSVEPLPTCSGSYAHHPAACNASENTTRCNLWDQAFERFRHENHELVQAYDHMLRDGIDAPEDANQSEIMLAVVNQRLEEIKSRQWNIQLAETTISIREQIDRIVKIVITIRDLGSTLAALDPVHAAPAWAGVCVLLSLVVNNFEARESATADIENVAVLIPRYKQVEKIYLENAYEFPIKSQLHDSVVNLYVNILEYQIELARYLKGGPFRHCIRGVLGLDDFRSLMQRIKDSDARCKSSMEVYDAAVAIIESEGLRIQLTQLDDRINQLIADITSSHSVIEWTPGPNTDPGYVSVLYGGFRGRAGSFRISLAGIESDKQLFLQMRATYAQRQHRLWRRDLPHPWKSLAWLSWFDVKRLEFVKYKTHHSSVASYGATDDFPIPRLLPYDRRLFAWYHPLETGSQECLNELRDVLSSTQRWGILIVEEVEIIKFSFSMTITILLSFLIGMVAGDCGRTTGGSLRASFIVMAASVVILGVLPHPAMTDTVRDMLTRWRMFVTAFCLLASALTEAFAFASIISETLWRCLTALIILSFVGLFYEPRGFGTSSISQITCVTSRI